MYDFVNNSTIGGICIASQNICDNDNGKSTISSCDICTLYPYVMTQKLPVGRYKFVTNFNKNRYGQDKDFGCLLNCEIYTTNEVRNNKILSQFPALVSKGKIKYEDLFEFQRRNLKDDYKSSEKLVNHLGYNKNSYISFEMYKMLKYLGYKIKIFKILEYQHSNFMKPHIDFLFKKKSYYKYIGNIAMSNTYKILANSLYGIMLLKPEKFKDFNIITTKEQANFQVKKTNFISRNIISENLSIIEMGKTSVVYNSPILIGSIILQNSKIHMYEYLYNIYPKLFGSDFKVQYMDTDSFYIKLPIDHEKYKKMIEENTQYFDKNIGVMEPECLDNPIQEFIALSSKCYSYIYKNDIEDKKNKNKNEIVHTKGIGNCYKNKYIDHQLFKKTLMDNKKPNKVLFYNISVKNSKIFKNEMKKNNIEFLNDKRFINNVYENVRHTLYVDKE